MKKHILILLAVVATIFASCGKSTPRSLEGTQWVHSYDYQTEVYNYYTSSYMYCTVTRTCTLDFVSDSRVTYTRTYSSNSPYYSPTTDTYIYTYSYTNGHGFIKEEEDGVSYGESFVVVEDELYWDDEVYHKQ